MSDLKPAVSYLRQSNRNAKEDDSLPRQRAAITEFAARSGYEIMAEFADRAVSGADALEMREGFRALLNSAAETGVRTIIVENASRFARDLIVQEAGVAMLRKNGFELIAADDPSAFDGDTPTSILVRQVLGAVSAFEKNNLVAKLKGAKERRSAALGASCQGRGRVYRAGRPMMVDLARSLSEQGKSLRAIAAELAATGGYRTTSGHELSPSTVARMVAP